MSSRTRCPWSHFSLGRRIDRLGFILNHYIDGTPMVFVALVRLTISHNNPLSPRHHIRTDLPGPFNRQSNENNRSKPAACHGQSSIRNGSETTEFSFQGLHTAPFRPDIIVTRARISLVECGVFVGEGHEAGAGCGHCEQDAVAAPVCMAVRCEGVLRHEGFLHEKKPMLV